MPADQIGCSITDGVAVVTIDRPHRCNALTMDMWATLRERLADLNDDPRVLVLIITGAGGDFSAGADIGDLPDDPDEFHRLHLAVEHAVATFSKPVIAAIRGNCVGGGCEIAVAADLRIADDTARFGITASRLGIVYPSAPTQRLVDLIGLGHARYLLYTSQLVGTDWAERVGLVNERVEGDVLERARELAEMMIGRSQTTIRAAKQLTAGIHSDLAWPDDDYREGVRAFREYRTPVFTPGARAQNPLTTRPQARPATGASEEKT